MAFLKHEISDQPQQRQRLSDKVINSVLVADDSRVQRKILTASFRRWGYQVFEATSGEEALEICKAQEIDLVVSDWMMPGMNGLEFCSAFRALERDSYGYFILLTSKSEKGEIANGLDGGADDFLTKPVNAGELRARIAAGERILRMERELTKKNRLVSETLAEIQSLYDILDRDLIEAKKLQQSLVREHYRDFGAAQVSLLLRPSGHVGGDLVGFFPIGETKVGLFGIDVSGHGITSALMTARLAGYLSGTSPDQNIALVFDERGSFQPRAPAEAASLLNKLVLEEMETEHYFTLMLGYIDLQTGLVKLSQAGHPHVVVQRANGSTETIGDGGMPVGLIEEAEFEEFQVKLEKGDRLLIPSDGITECPNLDGNMLDNSGLMRLMQQNAKIKGDTLFETLLWDLTKFSGERDFPDDVSAVLIEYSGNG